MSGEGDPGLPGFGCLSVLRASCKIDFLKQRIGDMHRLDQE